VLWGIVIQKAPGSSIMADYDDFEVRQTQRRGGSTGPEADNYERRRRSGIGIVGVALLLALLALVGAAAWVASQMQTHQTAIKKARKDVRDAREAAREAAKREQDALAAAQAREGALAGERARLQHELQGARGEAEEASALLAKLRGAVGAGEGELETGEGGRVTLKLVDRVLFQSGEADLTQGGTRVLTRVGDALKDTDNQIWVQGHTDDQPIRDRTKFASNWELSTARAVSVVHYLQDEVHIAPRRLAAVGFSQYRPVGRNRSKNRRIEIVLYPARVRVVR